MRKRMYDLVVAGFKFFGRKRFRIYVCRFNCRPIIKKNKAMKTFFHLVLIITVSVLWSSCSNSTSETTSHDTPTSHKPSVDSAYYISSGKEIIQQTFKTLSGHLKSAMQHGGVKNAVQYCNEHAIPLTDSLSKSYNVTIQRISHKYRNPKNAPDSIDLSVITQYQNQHTQEPLLISSSNNVIFYAPIYTKPICLTCHGTIDETLTRENYDIIQTLYPDDKATGFQIDDLRGVWKITFNKK